MNCPNCQRFGQQRPMTPIQICTECGAAFPHRSMTNDQFFAWHGHMDRRPTHPRYCTSTVPGAQTGLRVVLHCSFCATKVEAAGTAALVAHDTSHGGQAA